ncbi:MAG: bacillithiol system redox-active protein YtxJ [Bacillaceae bacterium]
MITKINTVDDFQQIKDKTFIIFKHSVTCDISAMAYDAFHSFMETCQVPAYMLFVQDSRELSNEIASHYGIKHESPQVLLVKDGKVVWHTSHWNIKEEALKENIG